MNTQGLEHIVQAIQREREQRGYKVVVREVHRASGIAGVPVPTLIEAYFAYTFCTVEHSHGIPCQWVDWLFILPLRLGLNKPYRIVLQNELPRPGRCLEQSVHELFQEVQSAWN